MQPTNTYCTYVQKLEAGNVHRIYHDTEYGFPLKNDHELFGRLILEINQAGLSWSTILHKKEHFIKAYSNFDIAVVANYSEKDR
ncbi:MAG: DNA-3-methyladenine glycosylase I, partial [Saprospiraceae bacterium]